jgi:hypothetical protein
MKSQSTCRRDRRGVFIAEYLVAVEVLLKVPPLTYKYHTPTSLVCSTISTPQRSTGANISSTLHHKAKERNPNASATMQSLPEAT